MVAIPKVDQSEYLNKYRSITLSPILQKVHLKLLTEWHYDPLRPRFTNSLGFQKRKSPLTIVTTIMLGVQLFVERGLPLVVTKLNIRQAFDNISFGLLYKMFDDYCIPPSLAYQCIRELLGKRCLCAVRFKAGWAAGPHGDPNALDVVAGRCVGLSNYLLEPMWVWLVCCWIRPPSLHDLGR